jgi:preprotein translocase subunit SecE
MAEALESMKDWPRATKDYIGELRNEMKKVTWPNAKQVQATTAVVILTVFAFAAFFQVVDSILNHTITRIYDVMTR